VPVMQNILIAVDNRDATKRAVEYVAALVADRDDIHVHLFHALRPLPPQLMESPGAEDPSLEQHIEQCQAAQQKSWKNRAETEVVPVLEAAKSQMIAANIPAQKVATHILQLNDRSDLVSEIIRAAREYRCHTVVVGYNDYSWIQEKFHAHIAEQLIVQSERLAVCVVK
jgi:nucleotide-binding universal stress UspA family protein